MKFMIYSTTWMNLDNFIVSQRSQSVTKEHILCDFIYMKCSELVILYRDRKQIIGLLGLEEGEKRNMSSFGKDGNVLK